MENRQDRLIASNGPTGAGDQLRELIDAIALRASTAGVAPLAGMDEALRFVLERICRHTGWPVGHVYVPAPDVDGALVSARIWHLEDPLALDGFRRVTEGTRLSAGDGVPGRVFASRRPAWVIDAARTGCPRATDAREAGLRSSFAFPIVAGERTEAVLEFFSWEPARANEALLEATASIGAELARAFERSREYSFAQQAAELYRSVVETSPDAIIVTDLNGVVLMSNQQAAINYGFEGPESLLGLSAFDFIAPEDKERAMENAARTLSEGTVRQLEYSLLRSDGTRTPVELSASVIRDSEGHPRAFIGVVRNIAERKMAAKALRETEERYRSIVETSPDAVTLVGLDRKIVICNRQAAALHGYASIEEMVGLEALDLVAPEEREAVVAATRRALETGSLRNATYTLARKDGTLFPAEISASAIRDADGNVAGYTAIVRDITERVKVEDAIRQSEEMFRTAVEAAPNAMMMVDEAGEIVLVNSQVEQLFGYSRSELIGQRVEVLVPERARGLHPEYRAGFFAQPQARPMGAGRDLYGRRKDGREVPVEIGLNPFRTERGIQVLASIIDITERKRTDEALRLSEEKFRTLTQMNASATFVYKGGRLLYANSAAAAMTGYSVEELLALDPWQMVHPDFRDNLSAVWERSRTAPVPSPPRHLELKIVTKTGEERWVDYTAALVQWEGGTAVLGTSFDITERKRTEDALRHSEERYRALYQNNPSMYFTVSSAGTVLSVNQFGAEQLGYAADELVGRPVLEVFFADDRPEVAAQLASCVARLGEVAHWEFRKVRKDGEVIWVKESARATADAEGETIVLIVCEDVTAHKRTEEELQKAREELEGKVEQQMQRGRAYGLTFRELTVLHLVAAGNSDRDIAVNLGISPLTVSKHVANILSKMGASSRSEASARAVRESLLA